MKRRSYRVLIAAAAAIAAIAAIVLLFWGGDAPAARADPTDVALVAHGQKIYVQHCAACHGANLEGQPDWKQRKADGRMPAPPHDETGHTWHHPDDMLFAIVMDGVEKHAPPGYRSDMPAYRQVLSDRDVWAVLAYIKSRWPGDIRDKHARFNEMKVR